MFDDERERMLKEEKLFLGQFGLSKRYHLMKMKDELRAETCIKIADGEQVWITEEFSKDELINFVDSITCPTCKINLICPICGAKMHSKESIDTEISQVKVGIELCNARLSSDKDCYYSPIDELRKGEEILRHLEVIKSKIELII